MTVYIVRRLYWEYMKPFYGLMDEGPIRAFIDGNEARRYARERDVEERAHWKKRNATLSNGTPVHEQAFFEVIALDRALSTPCYLVRLADPIRRVYGKHWEIIIKREASYIDIFDRLEAAEQFTMQWMPIEQNPFESAIWLSSNDFVRNSYFHGDLWSRLDNTHPVTRSGTGYIDGFPRQIDTLCEWILELGLEPPGDYERQLPETWPIWWELVTEDKSEWDCLQLRYRLGLPSMTEGLADVRWTPNPRASWMPGDGTIRFSWTQRFTVSQWAAVLNQLSIKPESELHSTIDWQNWWSAKITRLDTDTQNFLWWYLVPYPYLIIQMPLEGGKESHEKLANWCL